MVLQGLPLHQLALAVVLVVSIVIVSRLDDSTDEWVARLQSRFVYGVPWGTLLSILFVLSVYLFVQRGIGDLHRPVALPFRAWTYFDPVGMLVAGFAHVGYGHLVGNLLGTLAIAPIAEYIWGHYPRGRERELGRLWTTPAVRAAVLFPLGVIVVGLLTALFSLGPIIGFSGTVYAFAGFVLVRYPIATVLALLASRLLRQLFAATTNPWEVAAAESAYSTPWFASIAIQGHAMGLFIGIILGVALMRYRDEAPPPAIRLWVGALLYAVSQSLWAVFWYRGNEVYVLYRALGLALVFLLATLVAAAVVADDGRLGRLHRIGIPNRMSRAVATVTTKQFTLVALLCGAAVVAGPAIPVNLTAASDDPLPGDPLRVEGYEVTYAEDVPDGMVMVADVEAFGETTAVTTSGVIVRHPERNIWTTAVTAGRLGHDGSARVDLGGVGWRETVHVSRTGWTTVGGDAVYRIDFSHGGTTTAAFTSESATAEPIIANHRIRVFATEDAFFIEVDDGTATETAPIPAPDDRVVVGPFEVHNHDDRLFVVYEDTVVRIAEREQYR
ncbi:rhomboid family intramembrane serine protease [Haloferacaceae archaeon DSL9]